MCQHIEAKMFSCGLHFYDIVSVILCDILCFLSLVMLSLVHIHLELRHDKDQEMRIILASVDIFCHCRVASLESCRHPILIMFSILPIKNMFCYISKLFLQYFLLKSKEFNIFNNF